jgi:hypothetical protein
MADFEEIAGRTDQVAAAMHRARTVLGRVGRALDEQEIPPLQDVRLLRDDLVHSGQHLQSVLQHADALHRMPEYGGTKKTADLLDKVQSVRQITSNAEKAITRVVDEPMASAAVRSGLDEVGRTINARMQEVGESTQYAIDTSNAALEAKRLAKTVQVAANPTSESAQESAGSALQEPRHHVDGKAQDSKVER